MRSILFMYKLQTKPTQQRLFHILFAILIVFLFSVPIIASENPVKPPAYQPPASINQETGADFGTEPCPTTGHICIVDRQWTIREIEDKLQGKTYAIWTNGNQMTFAVHVKAEEVIVLYGVQEYLSRIGSSDYWVLTVWIRNLDQAMITHVFRARIGNMAYMMPETYGVWRGENAPPEVESSFPLKGRIQEYDLKSKAMNEKRAVTVYFPPDYSLNNRYPVIYMADGQSVRGFAQVLEPLILRGYVLPMLLVGVHSAPYRSGRDLRLDEYLIKWTNDPVRYHAHEHFFTETVRLWAESTLGAGTVPSMRAIMGYSNGADFAATTSLRKPEIYGAVMVFSAGFVPDMRFDEELSARYFLNAGTLETGFYNSTSLFARMLSAIGVPATFRPRVAGHDFTMWQEEFVHAAKWFYGLE